VHSLSNSSQIQLLWKPLVRDKLFSRNLSHPPNLAKSEASMWKAKRIGRRAFRYELRARFHLHHKAISTGEIIAGNFNRPIFGLFPMRSIDLDSIS
jgi:hypothetical protein